MGSHYKRTKKPLPSWLKDLLVATSAGLLVILIEHTVRMIMQ